MKATVISLVVLLLVLQCAANESIIEYAGVQKAQTLSGVITDQTGAPISQVTIQEMSDDWSIVLQTTSTDEQGRWSLPKLEGRKIHQIRFMKYGFHQLRFRVKLTRRGAKPLDFAMPVA